MSTSSAVASPARISASPERGQDSTESGPDSGVSTRESFAHYDPASSSWKTLQLSFLADLAMFSETWPRAGMTRSGIAYLRQPSAPITKEIASGSWPTPKSRDAKHGAATEYELEHADKWAPYHLHVAIAARARGMWPTPKGSAANYGRPRENDRGDLQAAVLQWPTPQARDHRTGEAHRVGDPARHGGWNLNDWVGGQLNPTWVELLMGYPPGWTDLDD